MLAIIDYGLGNLRSVKYALDRLGVESVLTSQPADLAAAAGVILPGVGAFGVAMDNLRQLGLVEPTRAVAASGKPLLGICLGVQLLFSQSEEHGLHEGLGIVKGEVVKFSSVAGVSTAEAVGSEGKMPSALAGETPATLSRPLSIPQMGWNQVKQERACSLFEGVADEAWFYFAHSYYCVPADAAATAGSTDYGLRDCSLVQQGNVFGTQFHPEKSGPVGLAMLANFCRLCRETT